MSSLYAMRRANGDFFAFSEQGDWRVPVFRSNRDAMLARMNNGGMMLFKSVAIDERAFLEMTAKDGDSTVRFWLVNILSTDVNQGHFIEPAQLAQLMSDAKGQPPVRNEV